MTYSAEISRSNPTAFLFLIDQSGSMDEKIGESNISKAQFLSDALNRVLAVLIGRSSKSEGVRNYFEIGVIGYGGIGIGNALPQPFLNQMFNPISDFEKIPQQLKSDGKNTRRRWWNY